MSVPAGEDGGSAVVEVHHVMLELSDEEGRILLRMLRARLDALHTEMVQTDSPDFNIQLRHEEEITQALIARLESAVADQ
jgi:hypothetical protein